MTRLPIRRLVAVVALSFGLTFLNNTLEPSLLGHKVLELAPDRPNTALGFITFAGLMLALITQPIVGGLSDRTRSRFGRRMPYFVGGTLVVGACLYLIAAAPTLGALFAGVLLIEFGLNSVQGPWQALMPDHVPVSQRGQASALKVLFDIAGVIVGRLIAGQLIGHHVEWGSAAIYATATAPILAIVICLVATARGAPDDPNAVHFAPRRSVSETLHNTFAIDLRSHPAFAWWFVNRLLFWCAFITLSTFLLFYAIDVIGLSEAEAQRVTGQISALLGAALLIVLVPASRLTDRVGRKPLVVAAGLVAALGTVIILATRDLTVITIGAIVVGCGVGTFITANWALIADIVPREEAARYMGLANIATAGGSALARLLGGGLIDSLNAASGSTSIGYETVYIIASGLYLLSALVALPLPAFIHRAASTSIPDQA